MKTINKRILSLVTLVIIFLSVTILLMLSMFTNANEYALKSVNAHLYKNNVLVQAGKIIDVNGVEIAYTANGERKYSDNKNIRTALLHIIGDDKGFIAGGVQDVFRSELSGYNLFFGVNGGTDNTLQLSLDAELCASAYKALGKYKGCIAVCNYKTGELICVASAPSYDMYNKPDNINDNEKYEGVYINRLFGGLYTPGSVFKIVTSLSAIENIPDIYSRTFKCEGSYSTVDGKIICNDTHGTISFKEALNRSCNVAFAQIAIELGADKINEAFSHAGLNKSYVSCDRITSTASIFKLDNESSKNELGWAGIGQSTTLVNPYAFLNFICAIANGGQSTEPHFVLSSVNSNNRVIYKADPNDSGVTITPSTASLLKEMLRSNVSDYYGDYMFGNVTMCGKTGTAEQDDKLPTAWFAGFSYDEDFPYAVVAVVEESGSGIQYAGNAAAKIMNELYNKL